MRIDLHIHTGTGSDGNLSVEEVLAEAARRGIDLLSVTDHDSIDCQETASRLAEEYGIVYITGVELNVSFEYPGRKLVSLDFLGYNFDHDNQELKEKLEEIRRHRQSRALRIMENLNAEFNSEWLEELTGEDMEAIQASVDGSFGRPHIADYLITRGIVQNRQEAFDKYLVKCDVPKYPLRLSEASRLIRGAGGVIVLAHPNDPGGTSLVNITSRLEEQGKIIEEYMLEYIDGVECWHPRHDGKTVEYYVDFCKRHKLLMTGGSDCHQKPIIMGTMPVPDYVAEILPV
ncbi:MAG: PHP domain-containing protein [Dehalococcoidia bacterium]